MLINKNRYATLEKDTKMADFFEMITNPRQKIAINKFRRENQKLGFVCKKKSTFRN